jgi:hypothetical protein
MPLVLVYRNPKKVLDETLIQLRKELPKLIVKQLDSSKEGDGPDAALEPSDITIIFHNYGPFDVREKDMELIIFAGDFPLRAANANDRAKAIAKGIWETVGHPMPYEYFVWVVLGKSGFWSYTPERRNSWRVH